MILTAISSIKYQMLYIVRLPNFGKVISLLPLDIISVPNVTEVMQFFAYFLIIMSIFLDIGSEKEIDIKDCYMYSD